MNLPIEYILGSYKNAEGELVDIIKWWVAYTNFSLLIPLELISLKVLETLQFNWIYLGLNLLIEKKVLCHKEMI